MTSMLKELSLQVLLTMPSPDVFSFGSAIRDLACGDEKIWIFLSIFMEHFENIFWNLNWWRRETFHVSCVSCVSWGASGACTQQSLWRLTLRLLSSMPEQEVEPNVRGLDVLQQLDGSMTKSLSFGVDGRWTKLMFENLWMLDDVTFVTWLVSFHFSIWTTNDNHEVVTFTAAISACHNVSEWLVGSGRHGDKASWNETRNQKSLGP